LRRLSISDDWSLVDFAFNVSRMFVETPSEMRFNPIQNEGLGLLGTEQRELQG
jgi:hypothetical protein